MTIERFEKLGPSNWIYDVKNQLREHIYGRSKLAFARGDSARDAIRNQEELEVRRKMLREKFIESLGGLPPSDSPLNPRITGVVREDGYRIEKVIFESRPQSYVTANLYVPDGISSPRGATLFLCGHMDDAKHNRQYQTVCRYLVKAGLVVLAQDPVGQGERYSYYDTASGKAIIGCGVPEHGHAGIQSWLLGDGIARYFVHDAMRGIDYLMTRPEVDPARIGVTGNSGGGTQTSLVMICDTRIAAAAPATFIMDRRTYMDAGGAQDPEQIWCGMSALGFDHPDILLMMAPKPVLVLAATYDFFPIEGTRRTFESCRRIWELYGAADKISLVEDASTHSYTRNLARASAEFLSLHLLGRKSSPPDSEIEPVEPSKLWCTKSGQTRADFSDVRAVHEENLDRLRLFEKRPCKDEALAWLRDKVFSFRKPCEPNPRVHSGCTLDDLFVESAFWWSQEGIMGNCVLFRRLEDKDDKIPLTIAVWDGGTCALRPHMDWIRETAGSGRAVMVLDVSGTGDLLPNNLSMMDPHKLYGVLYKFACDLMWIGDSLCALRSYDAIRALDAAERLPDIDVSDIRYYAHGRNGLYARLAYVLDNRPKGIQVEDGLASYSDWVKARYYEERDVIGLVLPGVLRHFDLPDLEKWKPAAASGA